LLLVSAVHPKLAYVSAVSLADSEIAPYAFFLGELAVLDICPQKRPAEPAEFA
jgi:hypothetical protein